MDFLLYTKYEGRLDSLEELLDVIGQGICNLGSECTFKESIDYCNRNLSYVTLEKIGESMESAEKLFSELDKEQHNPYYNDLIKETKDFFDETNNILDHKFLCTNDNGEIEELKEIRKKLEGYEIKFLRDFELIYKNITGEKPNRESQSQSLNFKPLNWNGNTTVLYDIFLQLTHMKNSNGVKLIDNELKEVAEAITILFNLKESPEAASIQKRFSEIKKKRPSKTNRIDIHFDINEEE